MLLSKVVVGKGYKMTADDTTLKKPPASYDSVSFVLGLLFGVRALMRSQVIGEVGSRLNYDELVVYDNDAIRPSYLVMYDIPEWEDSD